MNSYDRIQTQYGITFATYIRWCVTCSAAMSWTYNSMSFTTCVDKCTASTTMGPYYDGASYTLVGTTSKADEWITIAATTEVRPYHKRHLFSSPIPM